MSSKAENWVKKIVKDMLDVAQRRGTAVYYHMPVQFGMGRPTLDFICCIQGRYVAIETKAPDVKMTDRQELTAREIEKGDGIVYRNVGTTWASILEFWHTAIGGSLENVEDYLRWFDLAVRARESVKRANKKARTRKAIDARNFKKDWS